MRCFSTYYPPYSNLLHLFITDKEINANNPVAVSTTEIMANQNNMVATLALVRNDFAAASLW